MYRLVFSDLDETLLVGNHVPDFNIEAIEKAQQKGVKFIPCTGRGHDMVGDILHELHLDDKEDEYMIAYNGAMIIETKSAKQLYFNGLSFDIAKKIYEIGTKHDVCIMIFAKECCFFFQPNQNEVDRKKMQKANHKVMKPEDFEEIRNAHVAKIIFMNYDDAYLKALGNSLDEEILKEVEISYSSNRYLEFNKKGVSKGAAMEWLANYLDVPIEQTIGIGDNFNDVTMIQRAGLGVAVQCADDDIKAISDYVTVKNYDEGAVKEIIEKFIL